MYVFLKQFEECEEAGGKLTLSVFIDKTLLFVLYNLELGKIHTTDEDILQFLSEQCQPDTIEYVHDTLINEVQIDDEIIDPNTRLLA